MHIVSEYYKGGLDWLPKRTLILAKAGSQAYGTSTPESDLDLRGVAVGLPENYLGFVSRFEDPFEQAEQKEPTDLVIYEIQKYFKLAAECNPNVLELLWQDEQDYLYTNEWGAELIFRRDLFISKKAQHTFSGYAIAQLKRINTHRRYLLNPLRDSRNEVTLVYQKALRFPRINSPPYKIWSKRRCSPGNSILQKSNLPCVFI